MKEVTQRLFDRLAIGASVICAIHCIALPVILAMFPALVVMPVEEHSFHQLLVWFVLPSSLLAVSLGCSRHKDRIVLIGCVIGLSVIVLTAWFGHDLLGETGEKMATLTGAVILSVVHWRNYKLCRKDNCDHDHHH